MHYHYSAPATKLNYNPHFPTPFKRLIYELKQNWKQQFDEQKKSTFSTTTNMDRSAPPALTIIHSQNTLTIKSTYFVETFLVSHFLISPIPGYWILHYKLVLTIIGIFRQKLVESIGQGLLRIDQPRFQAAARQNSSLFPVTEKK